MKRTVSIDFSHKAGKMPLAIGLVGGPMFSAIEDVSLEKEFAELVPPVILPSEPALSPSGVLDVHEIFPDFNLDEHFELSYNFKNADKYVLSAKNLGAEVFLRLGEGLDFTATSRFNRPPTDYQKYARVLERIIAHYNQGFAGGYRLGIKNVELTMLSDRAHGFSGNIDDFFELYSISARYVKERMPRIRVGGYLSGGFRTLNHVDTGKEEKGYVPYLEEFLRLVSENSGVPLDFLSWSCYADTPEELALHSKYASSYLTHYGLKKTLSYVTEFNLNVAKRGEAYCSRQYPADLAATLITAVKSELDALLLADTHPYSYKNGLHTLDDRRAFHPYAAYHVMREMFKVLRGKCNLVQSGADYRHELYSLALTSEGQGYVIVATRDFEGDVEINLCAHSFTNYSVTAVLGGGERGQGFVTAANNLKLGERVVLRAGKHEVYFITLK